MSDLAERLRNLAAQIDKALTCDMPHDESLMHEAADEIDGMQKTLEGIHDAVYDVFAYRLGPDEWEKADAEFRKELDANSPE